MRLAGNDLDHRVMIVAEIGLNHEGSIAVAETLIDRAADAGADAVKFQTYRTDAYVARSDQERFDRLEAFRLSDDAWTSLATRARTLGMAFISTPFDLDSVAVLAPIVDALKISSSDNTFLPLLSAAAETALPMIVSTGLSTANEIDAAHQLIQRAWTRRGVAPGLALLHCVSAYPTPDDALNLAAIRTLRDRFGVCVGYSDHAIGIEAAILAVAAGARIIEKHFTLDTEYSSFRDHQLSADPDTLTELVRRVRRVETMLGDGARSPQPCEQPHLVALRRSAIFRRGLRAGDTVGLDEITWVRPGGGVAPGAEHALLDRPLAVDVCAGDQLHADHFQPAACAATEA